jgi:type II secretory pathway predicted ATPase ExeA
MRYPRINDIEQQIDQLRQHGRTATHALCQLFIGDSGVGKTAIIMRYVGRFPPRSDEHGEIRPVVLVEAPNRGGTKPLAEAILTVLGDQKPSRGTEAEMVGRLVHYLKEQKTELLIIDEAQHLVSRKNLHDAADFFKSLLNRSCCPILFVGKPNAQELIMADEQLERRSEPAIELMPFDWADANDQLTFRRLLKGFEKLLPAGMTSCGLSKDWVAARLHKATHGVVGLVAQLLRHALSLAMRQPAQGLTVDVLRRAFDQLQRQRPHSKRQVNPFLAPQVAPPTKSSMLKARANRMRLPKPPNGPNSAVP